MRLMSLVALVIAASASAQTVPDSAPVEQLPEKLAEETKPLIGEIAPPSPTPSPEHEWLTKLEGTWSSCSTFEMGPGQEETVCNGTYRIRSLGDFWIIADVESAYPGGKMKALLQIGYDPEAGRFIGTWADTTNHYLWRYGGRLSSDGKTLVLTAKGPNFLTGEGVATYRDKFTVVEEGKIETKSEIKTGEKFVTIATGELTRSE